MQSYYLRTYADTLRFKMALLDIIRSKLYAIFNMFFALVRIRIANSRKSYQYCF